MTETQTRKPLTAAEIARVPVTRPMLKVIEQTTARGDFYVTALSFEAAEGIYTVSFGSDRHAPLINLTYNRKGQITYPYNTYPGW